MSDHSMTAAYRLAGARSSSVTSSSPYALSILCLLADSPLHTPYRPPHRRFLIVASVLAVRARNGDGDLRDRRVEPSRMASLAEVSSLVESRLSQLGLQLA